MAGEQYVMLVNNFSNSGAGFLLTWDGDAQIACPDVNGTAEAVTGSLILQPNPVRERLSVELAGGASGAFVRIFDQFGRLVHAEKTNAGKAEVDVAGWQSGVYIFLAEQSGKLSSQRFVKL